MSAQPLTADQPAYWNTTATRGWSEEHARIDRVFAGLTAVALDHAAPQPGERAIDIGCGSGTTVMALAERVGAEGHVLGVDVAEASLATARQRIAAAGIGHAQVALGDMTVQPFEPGRFDLAFSRFGVMFFPDPVASFRHLHAAMAPGGRLAFAVFRRADENPWATAPVAAVRHLLPADAIAPAVPNAPGQFGWADPARVHAILEGAGFRDVTLTPHDPPMRLAPPASAGDAVRSALTFGPLIRATMGASDADRARIAAALETFFAAHDGPDGIVLPGAIWIVRARA